MEDSIIHFVNRHYSVFAIQCMYALPIREYLQQGKIN